MSPRPGRITDVIDVDLGAERDPGHPRGRRVLQEGHRGARGPARLERPASSRRSRTGERSLARCSATSGRRSCSASRSSCCGRPLVKVFDLKPYFLPTPSSIWTEFRDNVGADLGGHAGLGPERPHRAARRHGRRRRDGVRARAVPAAERPGDAARDRAQRGADLRARGRVQQHVLDHERGAAAPDGDPRRLVHRPGQRRPGPARGRTPPSSS